MSAQYDEFRSHTSVCDEELIVDQDRLRAAYHAVADELVRHAHAIYKDDGKHFAKHVTEEEKLAGLTKALAEAEKVRSGETTANYEFGLWQMVNLELTGQCIPYFHCED